MTLPKDLHEIDIIGISGKQYSGKDVLADWIIEKHPDFRKIPIARAIKQAYSKQTGLTVEEIEANKAEHRSALIALGNWGRAEDPDYWLKQVLSQPGKKIISDVRLQREYDLLKSHGAFLIRLNADRNVRAQRGKLTNETDPTETQLDSVADWDCILSNNGAVADFTAQLDQCLFSIK